MKNLVQVSLRAVALLTLVSSVLIFSSCGEVIDEITYKVTINNNSALDLEMWLSVDGSAFELSTEIAAGGSSDASFYVANAEYSYEAREADGDVYATRVFKQSDTTDQIWDID